MTWWLLSTLAWAEDLPWWVGKTLRSVGLEAPDGGLPDESLDPVLRARQGDAFDPATVRLDITTLFQVGPFASVDAVVAPWDEFDEAGAATTEVLLTYVVRPSPMVTKVRVEGNDEVPDRVLLDAADVAIGQPWFQDQDRGAAEARVRAGLAARGFPDAAVWVGSWNPEPGELEVVVNVSEGEPNLLESLHFAGALSDLFPDVEEDDLRRVVASAGVREGRPFAPDAVGEAQEALRTWLADLGNGIGQTPRGWVSARVAPTVTRGESGVRLTLTIEPGDRLRLDVDGLGPLGPRHTVQALGIDERLRLTEGFLSAAPDALREWLQERGWYAADVDIDRVEAGERDVVLRVRVDRGARHHLRQGRFPGWVGIDFQGNQLLTDAELMAIFDQRSEVLRRDRYSTRAMADGIGAAKERYRAQGYPDAQLSVTAVPSETRRGALGRALWAPVRAVTGRDPQRRLTPAVAIEEGRLEVFSAVGVVGTAAELDATAILAAARNLAGTPASPQALDAVVRNVVDAHRHAGWLEADARVQLDRDEDADLVTATVVVEPGTRILLRSVVVRGPRRTRPALVRREVDLRLGEPLTSLDMERARAKLVDLGIFRNVSMDLLGDEGQRDLVVTAYERARWAFEAGGGLATDEGVRAFGRLDRRNLFGLAHAFSAFGQVGFDWRSDLALDWLPDLRNPEWRAAITYTAPHAPTRSQELVLDVLFNERVIERTWQLDRSGAGPAVRTRIGAHTQVEARLRVEGHRVQDVDPGVLLEGEIWDATFATDDTLPSPTRWREVVGLLVVDDRRDDPIRPSQGTVASLQADFVPGWLESDEVAAAPWVRATATGSAWLPTPYFTFRLSGEFGHIRSLDGSPPPFDDRFLLGGTGSLRGFRRQEVGPRNLAPRVDIDWPDALAPAIDASLRDDPDRWVATGGDTLATGTLEALLPFRLLGLADWDGYYLAAFGDVGNTWILGPGEADSQLDTYADLIPPLRVGTGLGLRAATPVGPLQFDLALNPAAIAATGEQRTLLVDRWEEPLFRLHLTLGAL